jgi:hypothetical protein
MMQTHCAGRESDTLALLRGGQRGRRAGPCRRVYGQGPSRQRLYAPDEIAPWQPMWFRLEQGAPGVPGRAAPAAQVDSIGA